MNDWPCGGPPAPEWRLSLTAAIPALVGLQQGASEQHRGEALAAVDRIGQVAAVTLRHGSRVLLVEGLPVEWLATGLADAFYLHLCERLGRLDRVRGPFYEVYDRKQLGRDHIRYSDTNLSHGLHTDSTSAGNRPDVVGLLCVRQAAQGGATRLVNLHNACTRLLAENPKALEVLREDFPRQTRSVAIGQVDPSAVETYPVLMGTNASGNLRCRYMRRWIDAGYVCAGIVAPPDAVAALDAFDLALETDAAVLRFRMTPGDILLLNNHVILHDRGTYQDIDEAPRLMRRAWIYECYH